MRKKEKPKLYIFCFSGGGKKCLTKRKARYYVTHMAKKRDEEYSTAYGVKIQVNTRVDPMTMDALDCLCYKFRLKKSVEIRKAIEIHVRGLQARDDLDIKTNPKRQEATREASAIRVAALLEAGDRERLEKEMENLLS